MRNKSGEICILQEKQKYSAFKSNLDNAQKAEFIVFIGKLEPTLQ